MIRFIKEIVEIRKELQNIRVILESQFVKDYEVIKEKDENGKTIRHHHTLEDPLGDLRKRYNINQ